MQDTLPHDDADLEQPVSSVPSASERADTLSPEPHRGLITLADLLDLSDEELAEPVSRIQPLEQQWNERLHSNSAPISEDGHGLAGTALPDIPATELIPGLGAPGAVEVPVYLAGRTLHELLQHDDVLDDPIVSSTPEPVAAAGDDVWALPAPPEISLSTVEDLDDAVETTPEAPVVSVSTSESTALTPVVSGRVLTPKSPPAIAKPGVGFEKKPLDPPVANFQVTNFDNGVLAWPSAAEKARPSKVRDTLCTKCGGRFNGKICKGCGFDINAEPPESSEGQWRGLHKTFLENDSRVVRTIGAFFLAPGDLTRAYLIRFRRRYLNPGLLAALATLVFAVVATMLSVRPRPDRDLLIGTDRTVEVSPGLITALQADETGENPPNLVQDIAATLADIPVLWFPLMAGAVWATISILRLSRKKRDRAELVFTANFVSWFVILWAMVIPMLLVVAEFGFEASASMKGVTRVRYTATGDVIGLSSQWNDLRRFVISPAFHTALIAIGTLPWSVLAYRRAFKTTWEKALFDGVLIGLIPVLMLLPFR